MKMAILFITPRMRIYVYLDKRWNNTVDVTLNDYKADTILANEAAL